MYLAALFYILFMYNMFRSPEGLSKGEGKGNDDTVIDWSLFSQSFCKSPCWLT